MTFIGDRSGRQKKGKQGNLRNWLRSKRNQHGLLLHRRVWDGQQSAMNGITVTMRGFVVSALARCLGFEWEEKERTLVFQTYVIIDAKQKRTIDRLRKGKD